MLMDWPFISPDIRRNGNRLQLISSIFLKISQVRIAIRHHLQHKIDAWMPVVWIWWQLDGSLPYRVPFNGKSSGFSRLSAQPLPIRIGDTRPFDFAHGDLRQRETGIKPVPHNSKSHDLEHFNRHIILDTIRYRLSSIVRAWSLAMVSFPQLVRYP